MDKKFNKQRNLGGIDDLWDDEYEPNGKLHAETHRQFLTRDEYGSIANASRAGTLYSIPYFLGTLLLIVFGQWGGLFAQILRLGALFLGLLASSGFLAYAICAFFVDGVSDQAPVGKVVELVIASLIFLPLSTCFSGLLLFWSSIPFRAQASRIGSLFIGLNGAFLVYCGYSFPVAIALMVIVSFLCVEWLSRKLLRLA